jgi:hypothetical protein
VAPGVGFRSSSANLSWAALRAKSKLDRLVRAANAKRDRLPQTLEVDRLLPHSKLYIGACAKNALRRNAAREFVVKLVLLAASVQSSSTRADISHFCAQHFIREQSSGAQLAFVWTWGNLRAAFSSLCYPRPLYLRTLPRSLPPSGAVRPRLTLPQA